MYFCDRLKRSCHVMRSVPMPAASDSFAPKYTSLHRIFALPDVGSRQRTSPSLRPVTAAPSESAAAQACGLAAINILPFVLQVAGRLGRAVRIAHRDLHAAGMALVVVDRRAKLEGSRLVVEKASATRLLSLLSSCPSVLLAHFSRTGSRAHYCQR